MNHSRQFWEEVEKYCPDYRNCRKKLKEYHTE
ncbi:MAG: M48 family metallopeptidase [Blautia sp.]